MADMIIARGKHRITLMPQTALGIDWIRLNYDPAVVLITNSVLLNAEYTEDIIRNLEADGLEYEFR